MLVILLFTFQAKSTTKAAKGGRGKPDFAADKDLAATALKLEPVIPSSSSYHLSVLARPPAKNFSCAICNMQFVRKDSWGSHMRQHERAADPVSSYSTYRDRLKGVQILLSNSQAGPGRKVKQEQEEISRNHVQAF